MPETNETTGSLPPTRSPVRRQETEDARILEIKDLKVRYGDRMGLRDVTFDVACGERVAVVGPNGAGKTTLFKAIAGLADNVRGELTVHGHAPGVGLCVAYVEQRRDVDWSFPVSVAQVVMMGRTGMIGLLRRPSSLDWERVTDALDAVGLADFAERQIGELSGGEQQRMFIARALAQEAELVLMDEPLTGLDVISRESILRVLDRLREQCIALMVATHDLRLAAEHFDRVMLLNKELIGIGAPEDVFCQDNLVRAYGAGAGIANTADGGIVVSDAGCLGSH